MLPVLRDGQVRKMNESNLFLRIEGYAQENFTTETLAYMLETDATIRNGFLDLLLSGRRKLRRSFRSCKIETQPSFDLGRPDLEITSTFGHGAKIFVEVKTQSQEGEAQVRKYLSLGYVAYLTPLGFDAPDLDHVHIRSRSQDLCRGENPIARGGSTSAKVFEPWVRGVPYTARIRCAGP